MSNAPDKKRVAIMISGRGTNMGALIAACMDPSFPGRIVGVVSNRPDAKGLETASLYDIPASVVDHTTYESREDHDAAVKAELEAMKPDIVCLAGYMRLLTADFVRHFSGRMINIHPSLLPLFPGLETHARALNAGMRLHGCTVHFVSEGMDEGPIIAQAAIAIDPDDTPETLAARLLRAEHRLYPHALKLILQNRIRLSNGHVIVRSEASADQAADPTALLDGPPILISPDARRS
ncbi:phosphoribosylglycinamide formyltransferase [Fulvimarina sp. 2208YS6-2-32]|uniref:Phosphoribosylglycinamide formyltransferase n=1 Tax=Fulvimarina uroteuthidis TaxID=3098149 RepID=A0ABU5I3A2_9HYPH|nr:phosphoribosylglycinamide formyltransferase [Fulvimarina sp. 2208YS6-2-32]MDY8109844.1 phosphoribosylglycinamide formyltransferase [Fulvimarina sp. 2208YS6-2-32]